MPAAPGLYVHVPFCARVCPYCDFAVRTGGPRKRAAYLRSLLDEVRLRAAADPCWGGGEGFDTVYLGGGTPSSLRGEALSRILEAVRDELGVRDGAEVTLEANPEDVDAARLQAWRALGVTRLSLGVQSFDGDALRVLGRSHTAKQGRQAVAAALGTGFEVSLDLIFAVPGQPAESWKASLQQAVDLQPQHISCYELTVHEGTRFFRARQRGRLVERDDEHKAEQFFFTHRFLEAAGYEGYEVSNFARGAAHRARHNSKYWMHAPYLGVGPSAHSFDGERTRRWNRRRLDDWCAALDAGDDPTDGSETLGAAELVLEALALGLRAAAGVDLQRLGDRYGVDLAADNAVLISRCREDGLLASTGGALLRPTLAGMALADSLAAAFDLSALDAR